MKASEIKKRVLGVLEGCALGDAMGMPTEFMPRDMIAEQFPEGIHRLYESHRSDYIVRDMKAGEITDDTINTIFIAEMLIEKKGKIDAGNYIEHLLNWVKKNPEKSAYLSGPSTKRAIELIQQGVPIEKAGIRGTTNGACMKISPIGIISDYREMEKLADRVEQICMPTHNSSIAISGACAIAACISYGVRGGNDPDKLWDIALDAVRVGEKRGFPIPCADLALRLERVRRMLKEMEVDEVLYELKYFYGTGVETIETVPAVLAVVSIANADPMKTASICAELGADTDTIGAIATAVCAGMNPDIPDDIVKTLEEVNGIPFDALAEALVPFVSEN